LIEVFIFFETNEHNMHTLLLPVGVTNYANFFCLSHLAFFL
jgi:hypothetical protein